MLYDPGDDLNTLPNFYPVRTLGTDPVRQSVIIGRLGTAVNTSPTAVSFRHIIHKYFLKKINRA